MKTFITTAAFASFLAMGIPSSGASSSFTPALRGKPIGQEEMVTVEKRRREETISQPRKLSTVTSEEVAWEVTYQLANKIPVLGSFATAAVNLFWDTDNGEWMKDLLDVVQDMIDATVFDLNVTEIQQKLDDIIGLLDDANFLPWDGDDGDEKLDFLKDAQTAAESLFQDLHLAVIEDENACTWDLTTDSEQWATNYLTIQYAIIFAPLHLSILKEIHLYGEYYDDGHGSSTKTLYETKLEYYADTYQEYFDWMKDNFSTERLNHIDYGKDPTATAGCNGKWWIKDELDDFSNIVHSNSCNKSAWGGCDLDKVDTCLGKKLNAGLYDEILPYLEDAFLDTISSMSDIEAAATNYPPISCNPDQIHARDSTNDDWACVEKSTCLSDEEDENYENCAIGETCIVDSDCAEYCDPDTSYCYTTEEAAEDLVDDVVEDASDFVDSISISWP